MPAAEIIAIGTEILLGEIQDTNTRYLARSLRDAGVDLFRTTVVGDNAERIAAVIRESLQRAHILITTGGLGPTVDDPTREAVALAVGVQLEFRPELWDQITNRFQRYGRQATENNRRQAYVPQGAIAIENPVGTAPAFIVETGEHAIICLPGVPREMDVLFNDAVLPYLRRRYQLMGVIKARVLHTAGVGESHVDDLIGDLERLSNPTVGLLAHAGQVDMRITAKAESVEAADAMIGEVAAQLYQRLGDAIYGEDENTLESVIAGWLAGSKQKLAVVECGLGGELVRRLQSAGCEPQPAMLLPEGCTPVELLARRNTLREEGANLILAARLQPGAEKQTLSMVVYLGSQQFEETRFYGGPPPNSRMWAVNTCLDYFRRKIFPNTQTIS